MKIFYEGKNWRNFLLVMMVTLIAMINTSGCFSQSDSILSDYGNSLRDLYGVKDNDGYFTDVNQTFVTDEGIEIKLDQIMLEKYQIYFSGFITGDFFPDTERIWFHYRLFLNGERIGNPGSGGGIERLDSDNSVYMFNGTVRTDLPEGFPIKTNNHIKISIDRILLMRHNEETTNPEGVKEQSVEGPWVFETDVDSSVLAADSRSWQLSEPFDVEGVRYTLQELTLSPVSNSFLIEVKEEVQEYALFYILLDDGTEDYCGPSTVDETHLLYDFSSIPFETLQGAKTLTFIPEISQPRLRNSYVRIPDEKIRLVEQAYSLSISVADTESK